MDSTDAVDYCVAMMTFRMRLDESDTGALLPGEAVFLDLVDSGQVDMVLLRDGLEHVTRLESTSMARGFAVTREYVRGKCLELLVAVRAMGETFAGQVIQTTGKT